MTPTQETIVVSGNTIRLKATFYNFAKELADLSANPTLKIYTMAMVLITTITDGIQHPSTGVYYYDYVTDPPTGEMIFEFSGMLEDTPSFARGAFRVIFCEVGDMIL